MESFAKETLPISLEEEMRRSYLDYAMSVIVGRALPDVRDGLKPVHRRVLFAMHESNNVWNRSYVKCARIVGEVLGKYHPHGDTATYEALVRMAQDFPTAGYIYGLAGVHEGYRTGRGRVVMRARTHFEEIGKGDRSAVIVDELPYQVNKKALLERIAEQVREKKLEGISDIRDESDKDGMRVVIELKRGEQPEVALNNLYKQTQLQDSFGMNMVALVDGQPRVLTLKDLIEAFISHRREVVTRR